MGRGAGGGVKLCLSFVGVHLIWGLGEGVKINGLEMFFLVNIHIYIYFFCMSQRLTDCNSF